MIGMREAFENWCLQEDCPENKKDWYWCIWQAAWHARDAEIEVLKAKHAILVDALRVIGPLEVFDCCDECSFGWVRNKRDDCDFSDLMRVAEIVNNALNSDGSVEYPKGG